MQSGEIVQRAIDYIEDHLTESLTLEEIAGVAAMSLPNLYRLFHSLTGHPIKEYIRKRRINEAANFLRIATCRPSISGTAAGLSRIPHSLKPSRGSQDRLQDNIEDPRRFTASSG